MTFGILALGFPVSEDLGVSQPLGALQVADSRAPIPKSPNASELQNVLLVEKGWMSSNELDMY